MLGRGPRSGPRTPRGELVMLTPDGAALLAHRHLLGLDGISADRAHAERRGRDRRRRGIGRMVAQSLAGAGAAVGVLARSGDELAETVALIEAAGGVAPAADGRCHRRALGRSRARTLPPRARPDRPAGEQRRRARPDRAAVGGRRGRLVADMEVNLGGILLCTQLVLPDMVARRRGRIINCRARPVSTAGPWCRRTRCRRRRS